MTRHVHPRSVRTAALRRSAVGVACAVVVLVGASCGSSDSSDESGGPTTVIETTTTTEAPTTTTTAPPTTTTTQDPVQAVYKIGSSGPEVQALQERLVALGYRPGAVDGNYGAATASAVMAFQKHEGIGRDGAAGPATRGSMYAGHTGAGPQQSGGGPRLEVDIDRQIMFVTLADGSTSIINVSTGNGQTYEHPNGGTAVAVTPTGAYAVGRKIDGPEVAPLGTLYRPMYFKGGFAVHGSSSVPGYPASHGCVRVSNTDEDWLYPQIPPGTPVVLYGGPSGDAGTDNPAA